jgi:hypothetical protein
VQTHCFLLTNDNTSIVIAEKKIPQINIYDSRGFKKMKSITFQYNELPLQDILVMSVSLDGKWIVLLFSESPMYCVYASMEKGNVMACEKIDVLENSLIALQLNPSDPSSFAIVYKDYINLRKYNHNTFSSVFLEAVVTISH